MKPSVLLLIGVLVGLIIGLLIGYECEGFRPDKQTFQKVEKTTTTVRDTISNYKPTPIATSGVEKTVNAHLALARNNATTKQADEAGIEQDATEDEPPDSVEVVVPITQKVYSGENYRAYVSGYAQTLDSIFVFNERTTIAENSTIMEVQKQKNKHWGIGVTVGYGYTPRGFQPYIGIGISYSLWIF